MSTGHGGKQSYELLFDVGTIKHLGLQMYSTLPPVISELVANAWDANATEVRITMPTKPITDNSKIIVQDNGIGMSDENIRNAYLIIGRDRRKDTGIDITPTPFNRPVMGRKGIGKFSAFGIAREIEVETVKNGEISRLSMNYDMMLQENSQRKFSFPPLSPSGTINLGTKVSLHSITKFRTRSISVAKIRRGLARRFSVIGHQHQFEVVVNGIPITPDERDLQKLLELDKDENKYLWEFDQEEIRSDTGWYVSGWIGALKRTSPIEDGIQRGVTIMARGKMVQEPFVFDAVVGQQYALSYLVGELHAEFVDQEEDTVGTTRNSLVWDTEANTALKEWGKRQINKIAREWAKKRSEDNEAVLIQNPLYIDFQQKSQEIGNRRATKIVDNLVRNVIKDDVFGTESEQEFIIQSGLDWLEFDTFWEIAESMSDTDIQNTSELLRLFREWEIVEAKEMAKISNGRVTTIEKLQDLIDRNALEVPELHNFLKEFPWTIDPRWSLIDDEVTYSELLKKKFPDEPLPEQNRRIDFLCVGEGNHLIVVEIKRPASKVSTKELDQIEDYVSFMRDYIGRTSDPQASYKTVTGYLLCGDLVDTYKVREKRKNLEKADIFVRRYADLLRMVKANHKEFIERYNALRTAKSTHER